MKLKKLVAVSAAFASCVAMAAAQTVSFHGYNDYSVYGATQHIDKAAGSDTAWTASDVYADEGSWYNGRTEINANVTAGDFVFNLGVRLSSSLGTWYDLYYDTRTSEPTYFHQGNMAVNFWNQQITVYLGKFEEWNNGFVWGSWAGNMGWVSDIAHRDRGQHITAVQVTPYAVPGLRAMVTLPLPSQGIFNGGSYTDYANWKYLWRTLKVHAEYNLLKANTVFHLGFMPGDFYAGKGSYNAATSYKVSNYGEAYAQADMPALYFGSFGIKANATYDFRFRYNDSTDAWGTAHYLGLTARLPEIAGITIDVGEHMGYAAPQFAAANEAMLLEKLNVVANYPLAGTPYVVGIAVQGGYAQSTNGTAISAGNYAGKGALDWGLKVDGMPFAAAPATGSTTRYVSCYAYPSFTKNFSNGYFKTGVEVQYSTGMSGTDDTLSQTQAISWRVPFNFCFWF